MPTRTPGPTFAAEPADGSTICPHCPDEVIRNYDGPGTGWAHVWPEGHPMWLASGNKQCRPQVRLAHGDRVVHQATPADQGTVLGVFDGEVTVLWDSNRGFGEFTETHPEDSVHRTIETPCPPPGGQDAPEQRSTT